ncbi:MAG: 3'-5' exonuclease [Thermoplasmata archaeon]
MPPLPRRTTKAPSAKRAKLVVVDTETTGLGHTDRPPRRDGVVQVGMAWREKGKVRTWHETCNPGPHFLRGGRAAKALSINRLTEGQILSSPSATSVAKTFRARLEEVGHEAGVPLELRSYSRRFDEPFLSVAPWNLKQHAWGPCILETAQRHLTHYYRLRLAQAVSMLGLSWPGGPAHNAAVDSPAALLVVEQLQCIHGAP